MPAADDDAIQARFASMTAEELTRVVTTERDDYIPRAVELAGEELARRGGAVPGPEAEAAVTLGVSPPAGTTRWWHAWLALVAAGSVINVLLAIAFHHRSGLILRVVWALVVVPFALHTRRRARGGAKVGVVASRSLPPPRQP